MVNLWKNKHFSVRDGLFSTCGQLVNRGNHRLDLWDHISPLTNRAYATVAMRVHSVLPTSDYARDMVSHFRSGLCGHVNLCKLRVTSTIAPCRLMYKAAGRLFALPRLRRAFRSFKMQWLCFYVVAVQCKSNFSSVWLLHLSGNVLGN